MSGKISRPKSTSGLSSARRKAGKKPRENMVINKESPYRTLTSRNGSRILVISYFGRMLKGLQPRIGLVSETMQFANKALAQQGRPTLRASWLQATPSPAPLDDAWP